MFKNLRVAFLVYILLFVAVGQYLTARRSTDWDETLWVSVYPVVGDGRPSTQQYVDSLTHAEFADVEIFFTAEAGRFGVTLPRPFRLNLAEPIDADLPQLSSAASWIEVAFWSLRMRWLAMRLQWTSSQPADDIVVFAVFHAAAEGGALDRSTALRKGLIAVANLFADPAARGTNQVVVAHELLHTLGASDKYDPRNNTPLFPIGFAAPSMKPLFPQEKAELMAGRIALSEHGARIPSSLREVLIGEATALEIGWLRPD
jgi:hypothetical protein